MLSYLLGSVPFGYIVGLVNGIDIRRHGSRNIGATNVARVIGLPMGILVFALDVGKGALAAGVLSRLPVHEGVGETAAIFCGTAVILGHMFPVFLSFRGGKGVATACGVMGCVVPVATAVALGVWVVVFGWTRYVSVASLSSALAISTCALVLHIDNPDAHAPQILFVTVMAVAVILTHIPNIKRLIAGTEKRVR